MTELASPPSPLSSLMNRLWTQKRSPPQSEASEGQSSKNTNLSRRSKARRPRYPVTSFVAAEYVRPEAEVNEAVEQRPTSTDTERCSDTKLTKVYIPVSAPGDIRPVFFCKDPTSIRSASVSKVMSKAVEICGPDRHDSTAVRKELSHEIDEANTQIYTDWNNQKRAGALPPDASRIVIQLLPSALDFKPDLCRDDLRQYEPYSRRRNPFGPLELLSEGNRASLAHAVAQIWAQSEKTGDSLLEQWDDGEPLGEMTPPWEGC